MFTTVRSEADAGLRLSLAYLANDAEGPRTDHLADLVHVVHGLYAALAVVTGHLCGSHGLAGWTSLLGWSRRWLDLHSW